MGHRRARLTPFGRYLLVTRILQDGWSVSATAESLGPAPGGKKDVWYLNDYMLAPSGGGTILKKHVTSGLSPVVLYLAALAIKRDAMTSLRNLKAPVESKKA